MSRLSDTRDAIEIGKLVVDALCAIYDRLKAKRDEEREKRLRDVEKRLRDVEAENAALKAAQHL